MKKSIKLVRFVFKNIVSFKIKFLSIFLCFLISTVISFFQPLIICQITDLGLVEQQFDIIVTFTVWLVVCLIINQIIEILQSYMFVNLKNEVQYKFMLKAVKKIFHLSKSYFSDNTSAEIVDRITVDTNMASSLVDRGIMYTVSYILRMVSGVLGLFIISWKLAIVVILVAPIKYITVKILSEKKEKLTKEMIFKNSEFAAWFSDNINGIKEIKLWNLYKSKFDMLSHMQKKILCNYRYSVLLDTWNVVIENFLEWSVICILYVVGGYMVCCNDISLGNVFAFLTYSSYVIGPISAIMNLKFIFSKIAPSANRLSEFYQTSEEKTGREKVKEFKWLEIKNIDFSYTNKKILNNLSLCIKKGEKLAIIGENGSGKSTLINIILMFENISSGHIKINEEDILNVDINSYRNLFAVVNQSPYIFKGSIKDNIDLYNDNNKKKLDIAVASSGVNSLNHALENEIGVYGSKLSGGECQKIAIARAILKDSPIIILDEPTTNLDIDSHKHLKNIIRSSFQEKTVIMITHSLEDLEGFESVYRLEKGKLQKIYGKDKGSDNR